MLRSWRVLRILTCKCAFRHSGVQFLMSPLSTYLRTRRFNRPTFGLTRHTNLWKNTAFRDFSNIWRGRIFFLLTFWLLHLLSTDLITLLLLFNSPYCRKFLFKLPSINWCRISSVSIMNKFSEDFMMLFRREVVFVVQHVSFQGWIHQACCSRETSNPATKHDRFYRSYGAPEINGPTITRFHWVFFTPK